MSVRSWRAAAVLGAAVLVLAGCASPKTTERAVLEPSATPQVTSASAPDDDLNALDGALREVESELSKADEGIALTDETDVSS